MMAATPMVATTTSPTTIAFLKRLGGVEFRLDRASHTPANENDKKSKTPAMMVRGELFDTEAANVWLLLLPSSAARSSCSCDWEICKRASYDFASGTISSPVWRTIFP